MKIESWKGVLQKNRRKSCFHESYDRRFNCSWVEKKNFNQKELDCLPKNSLAKVVSY